LKDILFSFIPSFLWRLSLIQKYDGKTGLRNKISIIRETEHRTSRIQKGYIWQKKDTMVVALYPEIFIKAAFVKDKVTQVIKLSKSIRQINQFSLSS